MEGTGATSSPSSNDALARLLSGELVCFHEPAYQRVIDICNRTISVLPKMNASITSLEEAREQYSRIFPKPIPASTIVFPPLFTNFGHHTWIGEGVTINHGCSLLDMGGVTIEDSVMIGPKVSLITEGHPLDPVKRSTHIFGKPIVIKQRAWIGAGATILPGVTVGENSIVAAGAVVNKNVPANVVVAGVPAKVVKQLSVPSDPPTAAECGSVGRSKCQDSNL